jgi:MFS family permease
VSATEARPRAYASLWNLHFVLVLVISQLYFVGYYGLFVTLPRYLEGRSATEIGLVVGVFGASAFLMRLWVGGLGDVLGRRALLVGGLLLGGLAQCLFALGPYPALLVPLRLLQGLAQVATANSLVVLSAELIPPPRRAEAIGYGFFAGDSPALYAPLLALALVAAVGFQVQFVLMGLLGFVAALAALQIPSDRPAHPPRAIPRPFRLVPAAVLPTIGFLGTTAGLGTVQAFLTPHADRQALGDPRLFFVAFGLAAIPAGPLAGRLGTLVGHRLVLVGSGLTSALAMLLPALSVGGPGLALAGALFGSGFAGGFTAAMTLSYEGAAPAERGLATATTGLAIDMGYGVAILLGPLADARGTAAAFAAAAILACTCALQVALRGRSGKTMPSAGNEERPSP